MIQYSNLNYQGIVFEETFDLSSMEYMHMDVWTASVDSLLVFPISVGSGEKSVKAGLSQSSWTSIDVPLSAFTDQGLDMSDIHQIKLEDPDGNSGTIYVDNIYFYSVPVPMMAAATPTQKAEDVLSIYSQAYTNPAAVNYYPGWGQSTQLSIFEIGTDSMLAYSKLNYQGIEFGETIDASSMDTLHIDVWSTSVSNLLIFPISAGSGEKSVTKALEVNTWNSFNIPLTDFTSQNLTVNDLIQFKFEDPDGTKGTIYLDNIYFYKKGTNSVLPISFSTLKVYPNPTTSTLHLDIDAASSTISSYSLLNVQGQTILSTDVNSTTINTTVDVSKFSTGVYFLKINTENGNYTHRVIVQ
jgi:hypothetical protein